jgi:Arc/MetJ family transcription regulator
MEEHRMQKTTVEIDTGLLERAVRISGAKSKKKAIEYGLKALISSVNRKRLKEELGTYDLDLTLKDLEKLRKDE